MSLLSTVPDLCLLAIFDRVSVQDLCRTVSLVCKRWASLYVTACNRRKTLILVESDIRLSSALDIRHFDLMNYAIRADGTPYQDDTIPPHYRNSCLVRPLEYSSINLLPYFRICDLFATVSTLRIIQYNLPAYDLCTVQVLLHQLASTISTLQLTIHIEEPENGDDDDERFNRTIKDGITSIMYLINNQMPKLKHLFLNIQTPAVFAREDGSIRLDLKVIAKLETFTFRSYRVVDDRDFNEPLDSIVLYGANATALCDICVQNYANFDRLLNLSVDLAKKFTQIGLTDGINRDNVDQFTRYCARFISLTAVSVRIDGQSFYSKVIRALSNLHHLIHLSVTIDLEEENVDQEEEEDDDEHELSQLHSVVALSLFITTKNHHDFALLDLSFTMPNLQVILLRHDSPRCTDCGFGPFALADLNLLAMIDSPLIGQMQNCMKRARVELHGLEKLTKLNVNVMPNMRMNLNFDHGVGFSMEMSRDELMDELDVMYDSV